MIQTKPGKIKLALLVSLALFLSACGAKINTELTFADDLSGTRVMTLTLDRSPDNEKNIIGGLEAVDASIKSHTPDYLEYSGMTTTADTATATITLKFSDEADYREKITKLLEYSGVSTDPKISIVAQDSPLSTGFAYEENFSSNDLLKWIPDALVTDGVIKDSDKSNVLSSDTQGTIVAKGKTYESSYGRLNASDLTDNRFYSADITIVPTGESYETTIVFHQNYDASGPVKEKQDAYIDSIDIPNLEKDVAEYGNDRSYGNSIRFKSKDNEELAANLDKVFLTSGTKFESEISDEPTANLAIRTIYTGSIDVSKVASSEASSSLNFSKGVDTFDGERTNSLTNFELQVDRPVTIEKFDAQLDVLNSSSAKLTLNFDIPVKEADLLDKVITEKFTPEDGIGTLKHTDSDDTRNFVVEIPEINDENVDDVNYFLSGQVKIGKNTQSKDADYHVTFSLAPYEFLGATPEEVTGKVTLDGYDSFNDIKHTADMNPDWNVEDYSATLQDGATDLTFSMDVNEFPFVLFIILIVLAVILIVLLILAVIFRKKITAFIAAYKEKAAEKRAAKQAAMAQAAAYQQQQQQQQQQMMDQQQTMHQQPPVDQQQTMHQQPVADNFGQMPTQNMPTQNMPQVEQQQNIDDDDSGLI